MEKAKSTDDGGNSKREKEDLLTILLRKEKLANERRKRIDINGRYFLEKVVIEDGETRNEKWSEIFHYNIDQLIARNIPKMSTEQKEWIIRYNKDKSFGDPAPKPELGDPAARARIKFRNDKYFSSFNVRVAEMAIQLYNKNHEGSDFEVVELLSANSFFYIHKWTHINFRAKPINGTEDDEHSFFAEHLYDDFSSSMHGRRVKITDGVISTCCLMEEGANTNDRCGYCPRKCKVLHPINDGFIFHRDAIFKVSNYPLVEYALS